MARFCLSDPNEYTEQVKVVKFGGIVGITLHYSVNSFFTKCLGRVTIELTEEQKQEDHSPVKNHAAKIRILQALGHCKNKMSFYCRSPESQVTSRIELLQNPRCCGA